jgi:hypothetical protein
LCDSKMKIKQSEALAAPKVKDLLSSHKINELRA